MARGFTNILLDTMTRDMDRRLDHLARDMGRNAVDIVWDAGRDAVITTRDAVIDAARAEPEPVVIDRPDPSPAHAAPEPAVESAAPETTTIRPVARPEPEPVVAEPTPEIEDTASDRPAIVGAGGSVAAFDADFQELQQALGELDPKYIDIMMCSNGEFADGLEGPKSREAIETFAEEHGIDVSEMTVTELTQAVQDVQAQITLEQEVTVEPEAVELSFGDEFDPDAFDQYFMNATTLEPGDLAFSFGETAAPPQPEPEPAITQEPPAVTTAPETFDI